MPDTSRDDEPVTVLVSPKRKAHLPGCSHKGNDPDFSLWGKITAPRAWDRLRDGEELPAAFNGGETTSAWQRCQTCVAHGPWTT
jgi:hypothetical protein